MAVFLELTQLDGRKISINTALVHYVQAAPEGTQIGLGKFSIVVSEGYEDVKSVVFVKQLSSEPSERPVD